MAGGIQRYTENPAVQDAIFDYHRRQDVAVTQAPLQTSFDPFGPGMPPVIQIWDPTSQPADPGVGIPVPGLGGYGNICPPGTACSGPSIDLPGGISGCLGQCRPIVDQPPGQPLDPGVGGGPGGTLPPNLCDSPTRAYCQSVCGTGVGPQGNGGSCECGTHGRGYRKNKTRYYRFGDCRKGTSPGVVEKNSVCVKTRRMNPANAKASSRAARRVTMALKHQDRLVKAMKKAMRGR